MGVFNLSSVVWLYTSSVSALHVNHVLATPYEPLCVQLPCRMLPAPPTQQIDFSHCHPGTSTASSYLESSGGGHDRCAYQNTRSHQQLPALVWRS
jgi:hypothetical protein